MDPTRRDLEQEGQVENIIYEAGDDRGSVSPSMYLNTDAGEEEAGGSGEAGEVYMTRGINAIYMCMYKK